jgi:hypothetical protein
MLPTPLHIAVITANATGLSAAMRFCRILISSFR